LIVVMARGADAKLRRRQNRAKRAEAEAMLDAGGDDDAGAGGAVDDDQDLSLLPPKTAAAAAKAKNKKQGGGGVVVETVTSDEEDDGGGGGGDGMPKIKTSAGPRNRRIPQHHRPSGGGGGGGGGGLGSIKTGPLILLIVLTGTTLLPAVLFAGDYLSKYLPDFIGGVGYRLGVGAIPKKRVTSFYEKHAPEKLGDVPKILKTHYGEYPTLIKKLERKYQDYGYFLGWEQDETPMRYATESLRGTYDAWIRVWNRSAPQVLKTAFRNIRYNLTTLYKRGRRIWKKHVWPHLEPIVGVPKGAEKQKRQDAADARKRQRSGGGAGGGASGTRRKNRDYRDHDEE
jgi:hypothetical protein